MIIVNHHYWTTIEKVAAGERAVLLAANETLVVMTDDDSECVDVSEFVRSGMLLLLHSMIGDDDKEIIQLGGKFA